MMKFLIMHQTITNHDAIGNDIESMYEMISIKNYCRCFAENRFNQKLKYANEEEAKEIILSKDAIVIYHHSVNWEFGEQLIKHCQARLIFRYHNITPPEYFKQYNDDYYHSCDMGRKQTNRLISNFPEAFWLSDSIYNTEDLKQIESDRIDICPPFHKIDSWAGTIPDENIMKKLIFDSSNKVLFVGRVAPNKGHLMLLEIAHVYSQMFDFNFKFYIIGKFDEGLEPYNKLIKDTIKKYHLQKYIEFIGEINDAALIAYYLSCDVFLCTSDHEGFCVPVIEAQRFELPIIVKDSSALRETLGKNQVVLKDNLKEYAAAIYLLSTRRDIKSYLRKNGISNYQNRFGYARIAETFQSIMYERTGVEL